MQECMDLQHLFLPEFVSEVATDMSLKYEKAILSL